MKSYKHLIWDWNGTLFDDVWLCVASINELLQARNLKSQNQYNYRAIFDFPVSDYYERVGFDMTQESFDELGAAFMVYYEARRQECTLHDGAVELLGLCGESYSQSVLSAYRQEDLEAVLSKHGILRYFDVINGHHDIYASGKVESGKAQLEQLGIAAADILLIGDTTHDYEVAQVIGTDCLLLAHGHQSRERLEVLDVPVLGSFSELNAYLFG